MEHLKPDAMMWLALPVNTAGGEIDPSLAVVAAEPNLEDLIQRTRDEVKVDGGEVVIYECRPVCVVVKVESRVLTWRKDAKEEG